jgi:hypothetical protein
MGRVLQFTTTPVDGKLPPSRTRQILAFIKHWDGELSVWFGQPKRTPAQNRFYWGFRIHPITEAMIRAGMMVEVFTGDGKRAESIASDEYVHHLFKCRYLGLVTVGVDGDYHTMPRSTTDLSVDEFHDYVYSIETDPMVERLMAIAGLHLPTPGEAGFDRPFTSGRIYEMAA